MSHPASTCCVPPTYEFLTHTSEAGPTTMVFSLAGQNYESTFRKRPSKAKRTLGGRERDKCVLRPVALFSRPSRFPPRTVHKVQGEVSIAWDSTESAFCSPRRPRLVFRKHRAIPWRLTPGKLKARHPGNGVGSPSRRLHQRRKEAQKFLRRRPPVRVGRGSDQGAIAGLPVEP